MELTPEQIKMLLDVLNKIAANLSDKNYTITGAADWPILLVLGGLILSMVAFMWRDLRSVLKESKEDWREKLAEHKVENEKNFDLIWAAHRDCERECCPRRKIE